ncbi:MAG: hypothetical protein ACK559_00945, partial [bacterium]
ELLHVEVDEHAGALRSLEDGPVLGHQRAAGTLGVDRVQARAERAGGRTDPGPLPPGEGAGGAAL